MKRDVMIQDAQGIRRWVGECDIRPDGDEHGATVFKMRPLETDEAAIRFVVRGLA